MAFFQNRRQSLFAIGLAVAAGVCAAEWIAFSWFLAVAIVMLGGACLLRTTFRRVMVLAVSFLSAGFYFYFYGELHQSSLVSLAGADEPVQIEGAIDSTVKRDGDAAHLFMVVHRVSVADREASDQPLRERVVVRIRLDAEEQVALVKEWGVGDRLELTAYLRKPEQARNPHAFDYARYLRWQNVGVIAETTFGQIRQTPSKRNLPALFDSLRKAEEARLETIFPEPKTAGFMKSLLLGLQDATDPEVAELYADLGLIHVLAISGLHVTIVSGCLLWTLERMRMTRENALLLAIGCIAGYVLFVGASASAVRAGLMGMAGLAALYARSKWGGRETWGLALLVMLGWNPYLLWQTGFQLSFAVTLGLIELVPIFDQLIPVRVQWLRSALAVTVSAGLVSFPFQVYWFHQFSPLSLAVNLAIVPLLSLAVLPAGYAALLISHVHPAFAFLVTEGIAWLLSLLESVLRWIRDMRVPFTHWPHPHASWLAAYFCWLVLIPVLWRSGYQRKRDVTVWSGVFLLLLFLARQPFAGQNEVRITFLDVGQGDSIVVEVGRNTVYLIDGGGTPHYPKEHWREKSDPFEVGKDVVVPFLRARGIERIDRLVITHEDVDHTGGLPAVLARFDVGMALTNGMVKDGEAELFAQLRHQGVPVYTAHPGSSWSDSPYVTWTWLSPYPGESQSDNNSSIVLLLSAYGKTILFTGDLERDGEERLIRTFHLPAVDVLKVAHHGSRTSTSAPFLTRIRPKTAVISVGKNNRYNHPAPEVLERLKQSGTRVFRTDLHGAVTLTIRPDGMFWKRHADVIGE